MTVIVDEADNLFIDTANNSARISQIKNNTQMWMFRPIWFAVLNHIYDTNSIREILEKNATNEEKKLELNQTGDDILTILINSAITSLNMKKDVDYIIKKDKKKNK